MGGCGFHFAMTLTKIIEYVKSHSTSVCVAFLDARKAFHKISHWTLFRKLIDRDVPLYLVIICVTGVKSRK